MKGKRIAEVGDLVLIKRWDSLYVAIKRTWTWDIGGGYLHSSVFIDEVAILEKNFQETAPEKAKSPQEAIGKSLGELLAKTSTTTTVSDTKGLALGDELIINSLVDKKKEGMNWKEWALWVFIIICAIVAFYKWGYVE